MAIKTLTQRSEFECSYIYKGLVTKLLGKRYRAEATVTAPQRIADNQLILDFSDFKRYLRLVLPEDHYIYNVDDELGCELASVLKSASSSVTEVDFIITTENLCNYLAEQFQQLLNKYEPGVVLTQFTLRENSDAYAVWQI